MLNLQLDADQLSADKLRAQITDVVQDPNQWLVTPHELLGGRKPNEFLNSDSPEDRRRLRDLVESIKHGLFS